MPRYCLISSASAASPIASIPASRGNPRPGSDLGRFRFDGYEVRISHCDSGLRAGRCSFRSPLHWFWCCLKTLFGLEGGLSWRLAPRDAEEVEQQLRQRGNPRISGAHIGAPCPGTVALVAGKDEGGWQVGRDGWIVVMELVCGYLDPNQRAVVRCVNRDWQHAAMATESSDRLWRSARAVVTYDGFLQVLDTLPANLLFEVACRLEDWPVALQRDGAARLVQYGLPLCCEGKDDRVLTAAIRYCRWLFDDGSRTADVAQQLLSQPLQRTVDARLALLQTGRKPAAKAATVLLRNVEDCLALLSTCNGDCWDAAPSVVRAFLDAAPDADERIARWEDLYKVSIEPAMWRTAWAAPVLASLAQCLWLTPARVPNGQHCTAARDGRIARWQRLRGTLAGFPPGVASRIAVHLADFLWRFSDGTAQLEEERSQAAGALRTWAAAAAEDSHDGKHVDLHLSLLNILPSVERADAWARLWDGVEQGRWAASARAVCCGLLSVPRCAGWERVVAYCDPCGTAGAPPDPERAAVLEDLIQMFGDQRDRKDIRDYQLTLARHAMKDCAVKIARQGGSFQPLVRCSWVRCRDMFEALRKSVSEDRRAAALTAWLHPTIPVQQQPRLPLEPVLFRDDDALPLLEDVSALAARAFAMRDAAAHDEGSRLLIAVLEQFDRHTAFGPDVLPWMAAVASHLMPVAAQAGGLRRPLVLATLAQFVNSIDLLNQKLDVAKGRVPTPDRAVLVQAVWDIIRRQPNPGRTAVLEHLIALKEPPSCQPDILHWRHHWTTATIRNAVSVLDFKVRHVGVLVGSLINGLDQLDGRRESPPYAFGAAADAVAQAVMRFPDTVFKQMWKALDYRFGGRPYKETAALWEGTAGRARKRLAGIR